MNGIKFCPFDDILGVGHSKGFTSLVVPGAGESNFDSLEADPFEGKRRRREREVNSLLDKIPFDMITLDTDLVGTIDKEVNERAEKVNVDRPGYKATEYSKKTRLDRLKLEGKIVVDAGNAGGAGMEADSSDEEDDVDEDQAARERRAGAKVEKSDAKKRARGRNSTLKKMLRKRRRNVIDPQTVSLTFSLRLTLKLIRETGRDQGEDGQESQSDDTGKAERHARSVSCVGNGGSSRSFLHWKVVAQYYSSVALSFSFDRVSVVVVHEKARPKASASEGAMMNDE